ncbi:hypothetical protein HID58_019659, partial [Brassica napus]
ILVEDIRNVRLHKLETNLGSFQGTSAVKSASFVRRAFKAFYKHYKPEANAYRDSRSSRQPREANNEPRKSNTNLNCVLQRPL